MSSNIQALFTKYQQKYPLYTNEAIVEIMLDDGVITYDVAKKNQVRNKLVFTR